MDRVQVVQADSGIHVGSSVAGANSWWRRFRGLLALPRLRSGAATSTGHLQYLGRESKPQIRYEGEFSLDDLKIQDEVKTEDFVTLAEFNAAGIALDLLPNQLRVSDVRIDRPHLPSRNVPPLASPIIELGVEVPGCRGLGQQRGPGREATAPAP